MAYSMQTGKRTTVGNSPKHDDMSYKRSESAGSAPGYDEKNGRTSVHGSGKDSQPHEPNYMRSSSMNYGSNKSSNRAVAISEIQRAGRADKGDAGTTADRRDTDSNIEAFFSGGQKYGSHFDTKSKAGHDVQSNDRSKHTAATKAYQSTRGPSSQSRLNGMSAKGSHVEATGRVADMIIDGGFGSSEIKTSPSRVSGQYNARSQINKIKKEAA